MEMARLATADGVNTTACTPHIYPGLFENTGPDIRERVQRLSDAFGEAGLALELTHGADIQIVPTLVDGLRTGLMPTLGDSRYFLFEPPHHTVPSGFAELIFDVLTSGYVPIITHPERLTWLDDSYYHWFVDSARQGAWLQVTAGAVTGRFGRRVKYWSERFLGDGLVHILATDAHEPVHRPPLLAEGRQAAETLVGAEEAARLVEDRPRAVLENLAPEAIFQPPGLVPGWSPPRPAGGGRGLFGRLFGRS